MKVYQCIKTWRIYLLNMSIRYKISTKSKPTYICLLPGVAVVITGLNYKYIWFVFCAFNIYSHKGYHMAERSLEFSRDFKVADTGSNIVNAVCHMVEISQIIQTRGTGTEFKHSKV